jgi:peptide/nickel transport system permease protein
MIDVLDADFIEMNRAEGLGELQILYRHAARNALLPVVHYAALAIGFAFGGSIVIERVFSWPGIGLLMWKAVGSLDYPLAQGTFLIFSVIILTMNFLVDVISVYIDPRATEVGGT